ASSHLMPRFLHIGSVTGIPLFFLEHFAMRFARYFLVCLLGLLLTAPAEALAAGQAQTPATPAPSAMTPQEADGPVRQLSIEDAVKLGLQNNLGLEIERLNPAIEQESIAQ